MQALIKTKIGPFLVVSSVLAVWTLLAARPVLAHETTLPSPTCSSLPDDDFFTSSERASIESTNLAPALGTKRGAGSTTRERLRYAKITVPALAAGELRVFHTQDGDVSDAVLCRPGTDVTSRTSYSSHNSANSAAARARTAAGNAGETNANVSSARSALRSAASALTSAASALTSAGNTNAANDASDAASIARSFADDTTNNTTAADFEGELNTAAGALDIAANAFHARFEIRATVEAGDESYVLVVALPNADTVPKLTVQFHGAIEAGMASARKGLQGRLDAGEVESHSIHITAPGLLTLETTGSTDTVGTLGDGPEIESGGSGGNFKMVLPVKASNAEDLLVEGQTPTTTGSYTLDMDFKVAMGTTSATGVTIVTAAKWGSSITIDDDTKLEIDGSADEDYFVFEPDDNGFLTVEATDDDGATSDADTRGELYGPTGQIATDSSSAGDHFSFRVPVDMMPYLVKVTGTTGQYALRFTFQSAALQDPSEASSPSNDGCPSNNNSANLICPSEGSGQQERDRYLIDIVEPGTLYVHATGNTDTRGALYGPDGRLLGEDDNGASDGINFRIAESVNPGLHIVEVRGQNRQTQGAYGLVTSFVEGDVVTPPNTPGTGGDLEAEIDRLRVALAACKAPVETDATGYLGNPANGGVVSGIGVISGWVCAAEEIQVKIYSRGIIRKILNVAHGTSRPDTVDQCGHNSPNTGFGMTYNFNHLDEGEYTIRAFADGEPLPINIDGDMEATFEVVHLTDFAADDADRFLRDLPEGECRAPDFPERGETTLLKWEQSTQNFTIYNVLDQ